MLEHRQASVRMSGSHAAACCFHSIIQICARQSLKRLAEQLMCSGMRSIRSSTSLVHGLGKEPYLNTDFPVARCSCLGRRKTGRFTAMCFAWSHELLQAPFMLCVSSPWQATCSIVLQNFFFFFRGDLILSKGIDLQWVLVFLFSQDHSGACLAGIYFAFLSSGLWQPFVSIG